ncbi:hypothetical protein [Actinopolyspora saharensis]|uniref:Uncharacterized protein n=1 Tax=Actinopolyspora saharensis TaxID=995062 RepID=A0A1H0YJW6_9ACTN|nr:hypothetical protein [Actinopolyspora saharensis]SDQ15423.1 hypothetical protein SAMN04489718_0507 [Actinopolyspora saharensis]
MSVRNRVAIAAVAPVAVVERESFFDEFSGAAIDRSDWTVEVAGRNSGTITSEQQHRVDAAETLSIDRGAAGFQNGAPATPPRRRPGVQAPSCSTCGFVSGWVKDQVKREFTSGAHSVRPEMPAGANAPGTSVNLGCLVGRVRVES